jgi:hypothetical protein
MLSRQFLLIVLLFGNISSGFSQNLGDFARAERARRKGFTGNPARMDAGAKASARAGLIKEALRVSGAKRQLEQALETFRPSLMDQKQTNGIPAQEYQQAINEVFQLDRLIRGMEQSVPESVSSIMLTEVIQFYGSSLGRRITAAEIGANSPDQAAQFQRYASATHEKAASTSRQESVDGISAVGLGIPRPPQDARKILDAQGSGLWLQFVYNSFSDAELSSYLTFLKSPAATEFNNATWNAMDASLSDAAQRLAQKLAEKKP